MTWKIRNPRTVGWQAAGLAAEDEHHVLRAAERLKTVTRSGWTSTGQAESVAEHTWRLCLMAMVLYGRAEDIDLAKLLKMCLIHDLGEAIGGDVPEELAPRRRARRLCADDGARRRAV